MRLLLVGLSAMLVTACSLKDALTADVGVVARAGDHELSVDELAAILAEAKSLRLRREVVEGWAHRWVEYSLFAQRVEEGDSLLDRATVLQAMWPDVDQRLVDAYHEQLIAERVRLDSSVVDSAYAAGDHRLIDHILIRTTPDMSPPQRAEALAQATSIRDRLAAGGSWEAANEENDDPGARRRGGSLGVITRGRMAPEFEEAAFALKPGELSEVTETSYGFHVVRRPALRDVRPQYAEAIEALLIDRMDSVFLEELEERRSLDVRSTAAAAMREAADAPQRTYGSDEVLGTYRGGKFTTFDFVRWLRALPGQIHQQIRVATDEQLAELARSLMRNEALVREARESGMELEEADYGEIKEQLRAEIADVRNALMIDSIFGASTGGDGTAPGRRRGRLWLSQSSRTGPTWRGCRAAVSG